MAVKQLYYRSTYICDEFRATVSRRASSQITLFFARAFNQTVIRSLIPLLKRRANHLCVKLTSSMSDPSAFTIIDYNNSTAVLYPDGTLYVAGGPDGSNCTVQVCPVVLSVYGYRPTFPGSIALIVLFGLCGLVQIFLGFRYKTWAFMISMLLGCLTEIIGYIGRVMYYYNPWGSVGFIMQIGRRRSIYMKRSLANAQ